MKRANTLVPAAVVLLLGCQDPDGPAAPQLPTDPAAAVASAGLNAPSNANALAPSQTQIDLSWQDNSSNETGFEVNRSATGASGTFTLLTATGANVTAYSDQGLEPATQYCYRVRAVRVRASSSTRYSAFSNTACATTPAPPPPPPPPLPAAASGTTAVPSSSSSVWISWTDNSSNEDGFRLYRSIDAGAVWDLVGTVGANSESAGAYAVAEQPVCYRVVAFNTGGDAPPSSMACTTPLAAPTNLTVTWLDVGLLELVWNDNSAVEDGYQVWLVQGDYCCGGACSQGSYEWLVAELPANSTSYRTTGSSDVCQPSWFYVVATGGGGSSSGTDLVRVP